MSLALAVVAGAGPVEFGQEELARAIAERELSPARFRIQVEVSAAGGPESFRILPGRVSGGDIRGLMYGLLEAAEQVRSHGRLIAARGSAAMPIRGIRLLIQPGDLDKDWYNSRARWQEFFAMLARNRFNRLSLVLPKQPWPPRELEMLRQISQIAADYAIDVSLGVPAGAEPGSYAALTDLLAECPAIRSVQLWAAGGSDEKAAALYRDVLFRAVGEAGRRVTLELRASDLTPAVLEAARESGAPLRISAKYGSRRPAALAPGPSQQLFWELAGAGAAERRSWVDPAFVRRTVVTITQSGGAGFEIEPPQPPEIAGSQLFYMLWGRLSYNPQTPDTVWRRELKKR